MVSNKKKELTLTSIIISMKAIINLLDLFHLWRLASQEFVRFLYQVIS
jgi:hypothetical protein